MNGPWIEKPDKGTNFLILFSMCVDWFSTPVYCDIECNQLYVDIRCHVAFIFSNTASVILNSFTSYVLLQY